MFVALHGSVLSIDYYYHTKVVRLLFTIVAVA